MSTLVLLNDFFSHLYYICLCICMYLDTNVKFKKEDHTQKIIEYLRVAILCDSSFFFFFLNKCLLAQLQKSM